MGKPIIAETEHGAQYGFASVEKAKQIFGDDVKIVSYQDGTPYTEAAAQESKPVSKMNRDELETHAITLGIENPADFKNVGELREAIAETEGDDA